MSCWLALRGVSGRFFELELTSKSYEAILKAKGIFYELPSAVNEKDARPIKYRQSHTKGSQCGTSALTFM